LHNSKQESLKRVENLSNQAVTFYKVDLRDKAAVTAVFAENEIEAVIHFAGLKAVGESVSIPLQYYQNNISGTLNLCEVMAQFNVKNLVFSSSCTVYGEPQTVPITEDFPRSATNPYGRSKLMLEEILQDLYLADSRWNIILLRYFNPVGAHPSGQIGEDPNGIPNNLMPYITQVAIGRLGELRVFGADYPTPDGTGVRDYIHVVDLANGHIRAIKKMADEPGLAIYNLGTGRGYSVLEVVAAFEAETGQKIPYHITERRPGDISAAFADPTKANQELLWQAEFDIGDMCRDGWRWQSQNPNGYE
jgi:UDP-glucose 4-epimerase